MNHIKCRVPYTALDAADIRAIKIRSVGELLLRPLTLRPELPDSVTERGAVIRNRHESTVWLC